MNIIDMNRGAASYLIMLFIFFSCEEILLEVDISDKSPKLLAPVHSSTLKSSNILFEWEEVEGAASYRIQVVNPNFNEVNQFVVNKIVEETSYSKNLIPGRYEWRVTALNSGYTSQSATASFEVENNEEFSATEVQLIKPNDGIITNVPNQVLEWGEVENATKYRIQILEGDDLLFETSSDTTSLDYIFDNGNFSWQVRAETQIENTFYSRFTITVDTIAPEIAELIDPKNDTIFSNNTISFKWNRDESIGTAVIDSIYIFSDMELENLVEKESGTGDYNTILDRNKTYYWFIRSFDEAGNQSRSLENFSFTIN